MQLMSHAEKSFKTHCKETFQPLELIQIEMVNKSAEYESIFGGFIFSKVPSAFIMKLLLE